MIDTRPEHAVAVDDVLRLLDKHAGNVTAEEILAIAANLVGKLVALQDQRVMTPEIAMRLVCENIDAGNAEALRAMDEHSGTA